MHDRVRLDESAQDRIIIARSIIVEAGLDVVLLAGEGGVPAEVRVEDETLATIGGVFESLNHIAAFVGDAGVFAFGVAFRNQLRASQMIAVVEDQIVGVGGGEGWSA